MRLKFLFVFFLFCQAATVPAQSPSWNVQTYGFLTRYHAAIDYQPGTGGGFTVAHRLRKDWLWGAAGFEYTHATQELLLVGGRREARTNFYQSFMAMRGRWTIKKKLGNRIRQSVGWLFIVTATTVDARGRHSRAGDTAPQK